MVLLGLTIQYWYVALPIVVIVALVAIGNARTQRKKTTHRSGPRDPWLNEVSVALAELGLTEIARNTGSQLGGAPIDGDTRRRAQASRLTRRSRTRSRIKQAPLAIEPVNETVYKTALEELLEDRKSVRLAAPDSPIADEAAHRTSSALTDRHPLGAPLSIPSRGVSRYTPRSWAGRGPRLCECAGSFPGRDAMTPNRRRHVGGASSVVSKLF
jgi:hypothetical protein